MMIMSHKMILKIMTLCIKNGSKSWRPLQRTVGLNGLKSQYEINIKFDKSYEYNTSVRTSTRQDIFELKYI